MIGSGVRRLPFLLLALALGAGAAQPGLTLGVFLPTSLADGKERFALAEALAAELAKGLERPVIARNFGRFEDFASAAQKGSLNLALADGWALAQLSRPLTPLAAGVFSGEPNEPWVLASKQASSISALRGKRLAVVRGKPRSDDDLASHVVFKGDLEAARHFKLTPVPNVESALTMLEAQGVEAVLVPQSRAPSGARIVFRSDRIPGALLVSIGGDDTATRKVALGLRNIGTLKRFTADRGVTFAGFRTLLAKGPPPRRPFLSDLPLVRLDLESVLKLGELGAQMPSFVEAIEVSDAQPDD